MSIKLFGMAVLISSFVAGCTSLNSNSPSQVQLRPDVNARWTKLDTKPFKGKQDDIYFVDSALGFYVNGQGKIYRTRDGGKSWQLVLDQPGTYFRTIGMVDARHGFAGNIGTEYFPNVSDENPLYETLDGGDSWHPVKNLPDKPMKGLCAIDILHLRFINAGQLDQRTLIHAGGRVGSPAQLLRSLDGGKTWTWLDMSPWTAMIVDVKFFDEMNGIVFGGTSPDIEHSHALIVATHDGGKSWEKVYESQRPFEITWKGSFPSRSHGYASIQNYNPDQAISQRFIVKTIDGGKSWQEILLIDDFAVREFGVGFANDMLGWIGTSKGGFETRDGGLSWQPIDLGRVVNKIRILPDNKGGFTAFAIGADVYKFSNELANLTSESTPIKVDKP